MIIIQEREVFVFSKQTKIIFNTNVTREWNTFNRDDWIAPEKEIINFSTVFKIGPNSQRTLIINNILNQTFKIFFQLERAHTKLW